MTEALGFWKLSYENGWFVRLSIVDKAVSRVIGTIELCLRTSEDAFNNMGILRVDVRSDYEQEDILYDIIALITPHIYTRALQTSQIISRETGIRVEIEIDLHEWIPDLDNRYI